MDHAIDPAFEGIKDGSGKLDEAGSAIQPCVGRRIYYPCRFLPGVYACRRGQAGMLASLFLRPTLIVLQVAQQTALRAAFLVDQAIQEKQASSIL